MKKIFFSIILICLLSGCTANYEITITDKFMKEELTLTFPNNMENKKLAEQNLKIKQGAYYDMDRRITNYYSKELIEDKQNLYLKYKYDYTLDNLEKSSIIDYCFYKKSVSKVDDIINITTGNGISCFYKDGVKQIDKLEVKINTENYVIKHNADKVSKNSYYWYFDETNFDKKSISIKIDLNKDKKNIFSELNSLMILLGAILFAIIIVVLRIYIKYKKNNEM